MKNALCIAPKTGYEEPRNEINAKNNYHLYPVRCRFDISIYNYGYRKAKELYNKYVQRNSRPLVIENLLSDDDISRFYVISPTKHHEIINNPTVFFKSSYTTS
ncbi:unnamed protein product [Rhizophagus irregularis]|nr:unnamed protein product [Rhizophagus irregularis]CAB5361390.1 unnamed protein product [Rhizophagus irregularis]